MLAQALAVTLIVASGCVSGMGRIDTSVARSTAARPSDPYLAALAEGLAQVAGRSSFETAQPAAGRVAANAGARAAHAAAGGERLDVDAAWRTSRETFFLAPPNAASGAAPFAFAGGQAQAVEIELVPLADASYRLEFSCDGDLSVRAPTGPTTHRAGRHVTLSAPAGSARLVLLPAPRLTRCDGSAHFARAIRPFHLVRQEAAQPALGQSDGEYHRCLLPRRTGHDALADAFYAQGELSSTCPFPTGTPLLLPDARAGFDAKVKALLGTPLPPRFYLAGNPELPLDFSHAPSLSLVVVSYLDIKADFSGRVLDRLLRHHAARGTTIRILASAVLERPKDRAMLQQLAADHPNVSYKAHRWAPRLGSPADAVAQFHRVNHAKLLAAISHDPRRSVVILGGRNIHDGFLFGNPLDLSAFPSLQQYGQARGMTLNYYSNWRDIDLAIHDDATARLLAAHLATLVQDDARTRVARPFSLAVRGTAAPRDGYARHILSVPYADGHALEAAYIALFDAARHRIDIVNPYLNLTDGLRDALDRALARGVHVRIVGRISLAGDLGGNLMTAINEAFVARYFDRLEIYNYRDPNVLLHAKILAIDGRLTVVSGINLNNRSFIHDTENGLMVLDRGFAQRVAGVMDGFLGGSDRVTKASDWSLGRLLLHIKTVREAL